MEKCSVKRNDNLFSKNEIQKKSAHKISININIRQRLKRIHFLNLKKMRTITHNAFAHFLNNAREWMKAGVEVHVFNIPGRLKRILRKLKLNDVIKTE